jgi:hypothetical protein
MHSIHAITPIGQSASAPESKASAADAERKRLNRALNQIVVKHGGEPMFTKAIKRNPDVVLRFGRSYRNLLIWIYALETVIARREAVTR